MATIVNRFGNILRVEMRLEDGAVSAPPTIRFTSLEEDAGWIKVELTNDDVAVLALFCQRNIKNFLAGG